jgi:hypothetical protein
VLKTQRLQRDVGVKHARKRQRPVVVDAVPREVKVLEAHVVGECAGQDKGVIAVHAAEHERQRDHGRIWDALVAVSET